MDHAALDTIRDICEDGPVANDATRTAILSAVNALLAEEHPAAISVPAVADRAQVSVRTVYRYFPTKQELLDAVANQYPERIGWGDGHGLGSLEDAEEMMTKLWLAFADDLPAVRAQHRSGLGDELRRRRLSDGRSATADVIRRRHPDISDDDLRKLTDLTLAVTSSSMFLELHDRLDFRPTEAARLAVWIAGALEHRFVAEGGNLP